MIAPIQIDPSPAPLQRLHIRRWRQFDVVDIRFHDRLTVLTGANGAGKTTLINLLSPLFGWDPLYVASPGTVVDRALRYLSGAWQALSQRVAEAIA